jgi:hypothetical protein
VAVCVDRLVTLAVPVAAGPAPPAGHLKDGTPVLAALQGDAPSVA